MAPSETIFIKRCGDLICLLNEAIEVICMSSLFWVWEYLSLSFTYYLSFEGLWSSIPLPLFFEPRILFQSLQSLSRRASAPRVSHRSLYGTQEAEKLTIDLEHFHPKLYSYVLLFSYYYKLQWQVQKAYSNWGINKALKIICLILQPI